MFEYTTAPIIAESIFVNIFIVLFCTSSTLAKTLGRMAIALWPGFKDV